MIYYRSEKKTTFLYQFSGAEKYGDGLNDLGDFPTSS